MCNRRPRVTVGPRLSPMLADKASRRRESWIRPSRLTDRAL